MTAKPITAVPQPPPKDCVSSIGPDSGPEPSFEPRRRFTVDGNRALETHLSETCANVGHAIQEAVPGRALQAILLGGGYGRGEGGVLKTADGDQPYNDLEFYVFIQGNRWMTRRRFGPRLHELAEEFTREAGLEVEFHILSLRHLQLSPPSMFYYDLMEGHRWVLGEESLLTACAHHRDPQSLPISEATRLLMNRCSGLLFAGQKLSHPVFTDDDADFVGRNLAKLQLALGDAVLTADGLYHWSCRERHQRLRSQLPARPLPCLEMIRAHHFQGMTFKLHPRRARRSEHEALSNLYGSVANLAREVWLWIENQRLASNFSTARDYAMSSANKMPHTRAWQNGLRNLAAFGPAGILKDGRFRHPRERVLNALADLLWNPRATPSDSRETLVNQVNPCPGPNEIDDYRRLWLRVQ